VLNYYRLKQWNNNFTSHFLCCINGWLLFLLVVCQVVRAFLPLCLRLANLSLYTCIFNLSFYMNTLFRLLYIRLKFNHMSASRPTVKAKPKNTQNCWGTQGTLIWSCFCSSKHCLIGAQTYMGTSWQCPHDYQNCQKNQQWMKNWYNHRVCNKASHSPISHGNHSVLKAKQSTWSRIIIVRNSPVSRYSSPNGCPFPTAAFVKQFKQTSTPIPHRYTVIKSPGLNCRPPPKVNHRATNSLKDKP